MGLLPNDGWVQVGPVADVTSQGVVVVQGADRRVAVWAHGGDFFAIDDRCPHLGFPLHKGTCKDGIVTCHWHQARFDLCEGCTFDPWADDVPSFQTKVEAGVVWVAAFPRQRADRTYQERRLLKGMQQNQALLQAKALVGLLHAGVEPREILQQIADFSATQCSVPTGLTELAITGNLLSALSEETKYLLLLRSARVIAQAAVSAKRVALDPLAGTHDPQMLHRWFRQWVATRDRDGVERILRTASAGGPTGPAAEMLLTAACDQVYRAQGHALDLANKELELLDLTAGRYAGAILALGVDQLVMGRGVEENAAWHEPIEILRPLREAEEAIPGLLESGRGRQWPDDGRLVAVLLGDDPLAILTALQGALADGASPVVVARRVAYAAGMRLARFATVNEVGDWFNPQHTFSFANAVCQAVTRCPTPGVVRGIFHAALAVYMDRFLNVPPAKLPGETAASAARLAELPTDQLTLRAALLAAFDAQSNLEHACELAVRYLRMGHPLTGLVDTLALATVREDLDFHTLQVLEAGYQQARNWEGHPEAEHLIVAVVRDLAAVCPTRRAAMRTAQTALRLERGEKIYADEPEGE